MVGILEFPQSILCKKDVLGQRFNAKIDGIPIELLFPVIPDNIQVEPFKSFNNSLHAPMFTKTVKFKEDLDWGYIAQYPKGNCCVKMIALSIDCSEEAKDKCAKKIYSEIDNWKNAFLSYVIVSTKQHTERDKNINWNSYGSLRLYDGGFVPQEQFPTIFVVIEDSDRFASKDIVEQAVEFASSGKELRLEYQMLLSAYEARRSSQNRQAIIDASAAVELCLEHYIDQRIKSLNMKPKLFLDKFRSLGDRFDLVMQFDGTLPAADYQSIIVKPRNNIAHNREAYPSDETTDQLISCVETCLEHFHSAYY